MPVPLYKYNQQDLDVTISEERKRIELLSMQKFLPNCSEIVNCSFALAAHNPQYEAMVIETETYLDHEVYSVILDIVHTADYPFEMPQAFIRQPDVKELSEPLLPEGKSFRGSP